MLRRCVLCGQHTNNRNKVCDTCKTASKNKKAELQECVYCGTKQRMSVCEACGKKEDEYKTNQGGD